MKILGLVKYALKWTTTTLITGYLTYASHSEIKKTVNSVRFLANESETGFVRKEQALDISVENELNGKGNLETYLSNYSQKLPIYIRRNGAMAGNAEYNFSNFTDKERSRLCKKR